MAKASSSSMAKSVSYISAADLLPMRGRSNVVIIDVRDEERSNDGHIAGSLHFASQTFFGKLKALIEVVKGKDTVVFHCSLSLGRGPTCARNLALYLVGPKGKDAPKNIVVLTDGYNGWKASGKPVCHCKEIPCKGGT